MIPEVEKPRIIEIKVRMDCNGCVQKIKKALHGINGIYDLNIDFPQQKLTIIGWADPEKIVKAIKKTRRVATICSNSEPSDPPAQQTEPAPDQPKEQSPAPEVANPPPTEAPPTEAAQPADPPKEQPPPPPPEHSPPNADNGTSTNQPAQPTRLKNVEEVHVIYHRPPDYGYRYGYGHSYGHSYGGHSYHERWKNYPKDPGFRQEPPPANVTHSYTTYEPSPYVTHSYNTYKPSPYVTEYEYVQSPPPYMHYSRPEHYSDDSHDKNNGNGNITSMFSDENPNACRIV